MLTVLVTIVHVIVSLFLILVVLAQQGKGQDLASAFGGTGSQTAFGARGTATLLSKITAGAAILFMVTSLTLGYLRPVAATDTVVPDNPPAGESESEAAPEATTPPAGAAGEETTPPASQSDEGGADATKPESGAGAESESAPPPNEPQ